jgi:hypothetical protein
MIPEKLTRLVIDNRKKEQSELPLRIEARKQAAFREVERLVKVFRTIDPNLGRIVLFGSLGEDRVKSINFDIDLSFQGIEYYRCVAVCLNSPFKVDLVDYRSCRRHIQEEIDSKGVILYDPET